MPTIKWETFEEFKARHGEFVQQSREHGMLVVFIDGATARYSDVGHYQMTEPPTERLELLKLKQLFWKIRRDNADADFYRLRTAIANQQDFINRPQNLAGGLSVMTSVPLVQDEELDELDRLQKYAAECAMQFDVFAALVKRLTPKDWEQENRKLFAQSAAKTQQRLEQIQRNHEAARIGNVDAEVEDQESVNP